MKDRNELFQSLCDQHAFEIHEAYVTKSYDSFESLIDNMHRIFHDYEVKENWWTLYRDNVKITTVLGDKIELCNDSHPKRNNEKHPTSGWFVNDENILHLN